MRRLTFILVAVIAVLFGGLIYTFNSQPTSAQKTSRVQWEYAMIKAVYTLGMPDEKFERISGLSEICYVQISGCRRQEIKQELEYGGFLEERGLTENTASRRLARITASEMAFQKTLAQLGSEGWEIVGDPNLKFDSVSVDNYYKFENKGLLFYRDNTQSVYFKRLKAQ